MLSNEEKEEFTQKLKKLENEQSGLRNSLNIKDKKNEDENISERYSALNKVYEFIFMIILMSFTGYFVARYTNTLPWSMIGISITGFIYAFYRLYKSVSK
ncbi:MAG: AtpZ/AtpI family protein [Spirochaetia bacterium]|nr:AtpZ/AtpI family protein [Spirochaetia bacterium]